MFNRTGTAWAIRLAAVLFLISRFAGVAAGYLDNQTQYSNQDPDTETRRSEHFRICFGHYNRDTGTPVTEQFVQGNLQMFEQAWNRWVNEMGLHDINESSNTNYVDGNKYRANFNLLMTWNDGGGGGAYSSADAKGFFYAMGNPGVARFDPPSGATPHEFGHAWQGTGAGFNGSDSSGSWWEGHANWMMLQYLNSYPQAGGYIYNGMYYPSHGRDYYDSFMIWETARDDARYGPAWVNNVWTNATPSQRVSEFIIDRMIRLDSSGSPDKPGAMKDLWGDMAKKLITWDWERQRWLAQANQPDDGSNWEFYQRCRTPLVKLPGAPGWFRPSREHVPMEFGFNLIPLAATNGTTVSCNFQPQGDPVRQSDWRACLVAVSTNGSARYSTLWNLGTQAMNLSPDETKLYLVVIATPKPMKILDPVWNAYVTDAGLQFPYAVSFSNAAPKNVIFPPQSRTGMHQHTNGLGWVANTATVDATAYVGPNAQVLNAAQVRNNSRIEDYAVVRDSAQVRDNAVVSGRAEVKNNAQVYGNAKVRDWARVFGYVEIYGNARVIEHGNCGDGNATTHTKVYGDAVVKGTTYVYDTSTLAGCLIMDGDSANGNGTNASIAGVHFGWGWGQDVARFNGLTNNNYLYAQHTFERDNAVFAMDEYGINHGFLMNGARVEADTNTPARGGRVLPLNGTNQYVELHDSVNDVRNTTIAVWTKWAGGVADQRLWSMGDGSNKVMHLTPNDSITGGVRFTITDGVTTHVLDAGALPTNAWTHLAVVFTNTSCLLYSNGAPVATNAAMTLFPDLLNAPLMENANYLGRGNAGNYFAGMVDDFRVYLRALNDTEIATLYATPAPAAVTITNDVTAPTPNAATWLVAPVAVGDDAITMSATPGSDASGWVEYYFACTAGGGHDSGWVSFNKYTDVGLTPGTLHTYTVRMRDRAGNVTTVSAPASATTPVSSVGAASFAYGPIGIATNAITMTAAIGTNASGQTEYLFSRSGRSSGWQASPTWTDTGLTNGSSYTYTVQMRDQHGTTGAVSTNATAVARDQAAPILPRNYAQWVMQPYATISNSVSMTAQTPVTNDASGVQYFFRCVSSNAPDSGWINSATYNTPLLPDGTYTFAYKVRDRSASNESPFSVSYSATITPTTGYHTNTLSQVLTSPDDYLVTFNGTVMRVNTNSYLVKDLTNGASITVRPSTYGEVTTNTLALRNVRVSGHLYTFGTNRVVTYAMVVSNGNPTLYTISGRVTDPASNGIPGAIVSFSDTNNASSNAIVTATTDAGGNYSRGVPVGTWFLAASAAAYNTSADRMLAISNAGAVNVNFTLVSNAIISGTVTRRSDGTPIAGASVFFSRSPGASAAPVFTATTDTNGNYAQAVQNGAWFVAAGASGFFTAPDKAITVAGANLGGISFALGSSTRTIPRTNELLFAALTENLPASGNTGNWPTLVPSGQNLAMIGTPTVVTTNGVKWVNQIADGPGFRRATYAAPIPVSGATIVVVARPRRVPSNNWDSLVDIFYDRLVLGIRNDTGVINVRRNGSIDFSSAAIPDGATRILSLVVQTNGQYRVWANGVPIYTNNNLSAFTMLTNGVAGGFANAVNVGRNDPDGWTTFNGQIGDVFVYTNALPDVDRAALEADLTNKFLTTDFTITATANAGGTINPNGGVLVNPGGSQTFTITPAPGNTLTNVLVNGVSQGAITSFTFTNVATNFTITAVFTNQRPVLGGISNRTINAGQWLLITNTASDAETPVNDLTFSLLTSTTGATLNATNGLFSWRPIVAQAGTSNQFRIVTADTGVPVTSATQQFNVFINPLAGPSVTSVTRSNSQTQLLITGDLGPDYTLQATTNFTDWTDLLVTNSPALPLNWTDTNDGSFLKRFYRVLLGP